MLWLMLIFAVLFSLAIGLAYAPHSGVRRAGQVLLGFTVGAVLLVLAYGLSAYLSVTPGD
ncbi:ABC-type uncharacterized transport system permease subunit [Deinococcus sp. HSC-46F16]|uniref:hypothetical protein n=1 Tax=Deinococcus sp. HSC-46F16 TaxID=2910968 RepID=UPI0020A0AD03|nr:hypothetical protein [Deinococcus sp. HSC-46F16]MCP2013502.1 ABC-type uncharacterized transport system permease subunit [Deinococcus sp. HSC-46F16]